MYGNCLKCGEDVSELMNWDSLHDIIECPKCGHKMVVFYDEDWNEETDESNEWWWLEDYEQI